jgi:predicted TIM-barrel fold metal-dependent hydrolase
VGRHTENIRSLSIPEEEKRMILGENAKKLLKLK